MSNPKRKTAVIRARVSESLKRDVKRRAAKMQLGESTLITLAMIEFLEKNGADLSGVPEIQTR